MTASSTFNLVDEPWIEVLITTGESQTLSIRDVFHRSSEIRQLAGELPTQDAAVLRLLLAILYRALPVSEGDEESTTEVWHAWWQERALPLDQVDDYLDAWKHRFDLLHPEHPFFQVADLQTASGRTSGIGTLIADLPAGHKFFTNRAGADTAGLSLPEAARWLVHCQAYDTSGIKSGAAGDPRVKGGKGYPIGTGWAGNLGLVILQGETLAETLLLNLVLTTPSADDDKPWWEVEEWSAVPTGSDSPVGPAQALTWPMRRIRLHVEEDRVRDALVSNGDQIRVRNQHRVEPMSGWRRSIPQQRKHKEDVVYMARTHSTERSIWRGLNTLIAGDSIAVGAERGSEALRAGTLQWLALLEEYGRIEPDELVSLHTVGMEYGTQNASVTAVLSDRLDIRAEVAQDRALQDAAMRAVRVVEQAAYLLGRLADNLARAEGRDRADDQDRRRESTYQQLDHPFRRWLAELSSETVGDLEPAWVMLVRREAVTTAEEMYAASSPSAIKGRVTTDRNGRSLRLDAAQAYGRFRSQLDQDVPPPPTTTTQQPEEGDHE